MRNFSLVPQSNESSLEQYSKFLSQEIYHDIQPPYDLNDPLFLHKVGILQAESIRRAINTNSAVTYVGFEETNVRLGSIANMLTSSLDEGFSKLNYSLANIDDGINRVNSNLSSVNTGIYGINDKLTGLGGMVRDGFADLNTAVDIANFQLSRTNRQLEAIGYIVGEGFNRIDNNFSVLGNMVGQGFNRMNNNIVALGNMVGQGLDRMNTNMVALGKMVGQGFSNLHTQLSMSNNLLDNVLEELKIPESQRERRFHVEQGAKYLSNALANGKQLYFEDALDEFKKAIEIERKDFFSWFNLGLIYLRSKDHIDIPKAISAFEKFIHYAQAESMHKKNKELEYQIDKAFLYIAESCYIQKDNEEAISQVENCKHLKDKADFLKIKYLSATNDKNSKNEAANILAQQIIKNPLFVLQVLNDDDISRNDIIIALLDGFRRTAFKKATALWSKRERIGQSSYLFKQAKNRISEIEKLLKTQSFLQLLEAIDLMEKEYDWKSRSGSRFTSNILNLVSCFSKEEESEKQKLLKECTDFHKSKKYGKAVDSFSRFLQTWPRDASIMERMTYLLPSLESDKDADVYYKKLLELLPDDPKDYRNLLAKGRALERLGKYEESIPYFEKIIKLDPDSRLSYYCKINALNKLERWNDMLYCSSNFGNKFPNDPYFLSNLALAYEKMGDKNKAIIFYKIAYENGYDFLLDRIMRLEQQSR